MEFTGSKVLENYRFQDPIKNIGSKTHKNTGSKTLTGSETHDRVFENGPTMGLGTGFFS